MWLVATIESSIGWPTQETTIEYQKRNFILRPESREFFADIITKFRDETLIEMESVLQEFCSMIAWVEDGAVSVIDNYFSDAEIPPRAARPPKVVHGDFPTFVAIPADDSLNLMLALYREALGVNSPLFAFFGFFKVLNTKLAGDDQKVWMDNNVDRIQEPAALARLKELRKDGKDIGRHIYNDIRMAVIHASENHNVNPDDPKAMLKLLRDLPLMRSLAELFIQDAITNLPAATP